MKKNLLPFFAFLMLFTVSAKAQMGTSHQNTNVLTPAFQKPLTSVQPVSATFTKTEQDNSTDRLITDPSVQFSNDITIQTDTADQRNVKITTAFNGWIFSAFTINVAGQGGIEIRKSVDGGMTWTTFMRALVANVTYPAIDITVGGNDTASLTVFLTGVIHSFTSGTYGVWVDRYKATSGMFINEDYFDGNTSNKIYDVAIASDYAHPSGLSSPFSIGLIYSKNAPLDSVIYASSINGGLNYTAREKVFTTSHFCGKVAIAYGYSSSYSNGRYFVAFENKALPYNNVGNVLFSHTTTNPASSFQTPIYVDSINSSCAGRMGHPRISCSNSLLDNDSGNISTIIMADRNFGGGDYDVVAEYSVYSVYSALSQWHNIFVASSTSYETGADAAYNDSLKLFNITYYDSITHQLYAKRHDVNLGENPALFTLQNSQYNDLTTNLIQPFPRVAVNPATGMPCYVWNSEGANNGIALFDAMDNVTGIPTASSEYNFSAPYPNPANGVVNFNYTLDAAQTVQLSIINLLGQELISPINSGMQAKGEYHLPVDLSNLPNGVYVYRFIIGTQIKTGNLVIAH